MKSYKLYLLALAAALLAGCTDDVSVPSGGGTEIGGGTETGGGTEGGAVCGDASIDGDENCDDGNTDNNDGCSSECRIEPGWVCDASGCKRTDTDAVCGNGDVEYGEACDDGNADAGDGCSDACQLEEGWKCVTPGERCVAIPVCGNSKIEEGETCDDGNTDSGDGCSSTCDIESGWRCPIEGSACSRNSCGDGILQEEDGEACDEGDYNIDYAHNSNSCGTNCQKAHYCGDGLLDEIDKKNGEECDPATGFNPDDYNGCDRTCKRVNFCGDGKISGDEQCDDGNTEDNDGCSSECKYAGNFSCSTVDGRTVCSPINCGNGKIDDGEECDDANRVAGDGCSAACHVEKTWKCVTKEGKSECTKTCGNGVLDADAGETCDDGNVKSGDGCSAMCLVEAGYICEGKTCVARACGDGVVAGNEECDDGNSVFEDGCSKFCKREEGYHCDTPGKKCVPDQCGDGKVTGDETCDTGKADSTGCKNCQTVLGYKCEKPGEACTKTVCGDGKVEGAETCDENSPCCKNCTIQPFCSCDASGKNCVQGACGNGKLEAGEACDDGNLKAGDGCSPDCKTEAIFSCTDGVCKATCGDGLTLVEAGEECDDGNLTNGDGCSSDCKVEKGYQCTAPDPKAEPDVLNLPVIYRDFRAYHFGSTGDQDYGDYKTPHEGMHGFFTKAEYDKLPAQCKKPSLGGTGEYRFRHFPLPGSPIPDFNGNGCYSYNKCANAIYPELSAAGRPKLRPANEITKSPMADGNFNNYETCAQLYTCPEVFDYWYRDCDETKMCVTIPSTLPLRKKTVSNPDGSKTTKYHFLYTENGYAGGSFWPLDNMGYNASDAAEKYGVREAAHGLFTTEFQSYFKYNGNETLTFAGDDDVWVFFNGHLALEFAGIHGNWQQSITLTAEKAKEFGMYPGGIYSLQMFHAERCQGGSTFELSLTGFVNMGTSDCDVVCGDGIVRGKEECDYVGITTNVELQKKYGCSSTCKLQPYCGNGKIESGEGCDSSDSWCKDCKITTCGNGKLDEHEQCDPTAAASDKNDKAHCLPTCRLVGCGDGVVSDGEECDDGNKSDDDMCTSKCTEPRCGDGIVSPAVGEVCDDGINNGAYGGCGFGCTYLPPFCGDGNVDTAAGEECDDGTANNKGGYGGCKADCKLDIHCGDGILQTEFGESCDPKDPETGKNCGNNCHPIIY